MTHLSTPDPAINMDKSKALEMKKRDPYLIRKITGIKSIFLAVQLYPE